MQLAGLVGTDALFMKVSGISSLEGLSALGM